MDKSRADRNSEALAAFGYSKEEQKAAENFLRSLSDEELKEIGLRWCRNCGDKWIPIEDTYCQTCGM